MTTNARLAETITADEGWFVVWTESRAEKQVARQLAAQGMIVWLPTMTERHRWSDRWKAVVLPLFPGYLFARGTGQWRRALQTTGILSVLRTGTQPIMLTDRFVSMLRSALDRCDAARVTEDPVTDHVNDEVLVKEGPLEELRGVVRELRGGKQLVVWIKEIGRGVAFTLQAAVVARGGRSGFVHDTVAPSSFRRLQTQ